MFTSFLNRLIMFKAMLFVGRFLSKRTATNLDDIAVEFIAKFIGNKVKNASPEEKEKIFRNITLNNKKGLSALSMKTGRSNSIIVKIFNYNVSYNFKTEKIRWLKGK